jgi:ATP-dependent Clp protease ATP-binding subunit ClpC
LKNAPVLIGPAGVGKTAIVEGLAQRIVQGRVPENLLNSRVVVLDLSLLSVGTRYRGDLEARLKQILREIVNVAKIIIVIDNLHALVQTGVPEGSLDVVNLFKPMLARGDFQCIATSTLDAYHKSIEVDPALARRFQTVLVRETTVTETLDILRGLRAHYENFHRVTISDEALLAAVRMSSRYIQGRSQPDKAIDLVDEATSRLCVQHSVMPDNVRQLRAEVAAAQREKDCAIARYDFAQAALILFYERQKRQALINSRSGLYFMSRILRR